MRPKKSTIKYKGTRTHWVQYLYPLYSISTCPIVTWCKKDRNGFLAKVKFGYYQGKHGLNIKPVDCKTIHSVQFRSDAQSCLTLCDPMNYSMPGLPVHHQLPESTQTCPSSLWCHLTISSSVVPFASCPQSLPASGSFQMSQIFTWVGQSTGFSASASVLPMNTQDWSPLWWTGWISLQSKGLSRVFSNTTVQKHQFFSAQLSL